ncbi:MAG: hypothetical protein GY754_32905 [bacterium]|nr:hypothetical protein [bacterium]
MKKFLKSLLIIIMLTTISSCDYPLTDENKWWIWDLSVMPPQNTQIYAHVRARSKHVYALVEYDAWGNTVNMEALDTILTAWNWSTPANCHAGIYEITTELFGNPPDVFDNDDRIYLFMYEMEGFMGKTFDGYFRIDDQTDGPTSNKHEMLHINTAIHAPDSNYMLSVQAHEFQHLIHHGADPDEELWLNESLSELAMVVTGFGNDEVWVNRWLEDPRAPLIDNSPSGNYGIFLLFGTYLHERFGDDFIRDLVADTENGTASLDGLLGALPNPTDFETVLGDLALAIAVNDTTFEGGIYGYNSITFNEVSSSDLSTETVSVTAPANGGMTFISSKIGRDNLTLRLNTDAVSGLQVRVAFSGGTGSSLMADQITGPVTDIQLGTWPEGATLRITAANPGGSDAALAASFVSPGE